jgi:hypothetical protein
MATERETSRERVMRIHERAGHPTTDVYDVTVEV